MLIVVAVVAGVVWYRIGVGGGNEPVPRRRRRLLRPNAGDDDHRSGEHPVVVRHVDIRTSTSGTKAARRRVAVHVAGAVTRPASSSCPPGHG